MSFTSLSSTSWVVSLGPEGNPFFCLLWGFPFFPVVGFAPPSAPGFPASFGVEGGWDFGDGAGVGESLEGWLLAAGSFFGLVAPVPVPVLGLEGLVAPSKLSVFNLAGARDFGAMKGGRNRGRVGGTGERTDDGRADDGRVEGRTEQRKPLGSGCSLEGNDRGGEQTERGASSQSRFYCV